MVLLLCGGVVLHDLAVLLVGPFVTGYGIGFTWYGLMTFITALYVGSDIITYFKSI